MWLTRTMENILSMTKIESGAEFISRKEEVLEDLVYEAERHVSGLKDSRNSNRPCRRKCLPRMWMHV